MPNPFYRAPITQNPLAGLSNMVQQFNQFVSTFRGNPKEQVENLLATGQMTREQYEMLSKTANQFQQMLGKR